MASVPLSDPQLADLDIRFVTEPDALGLGRVQINGRYYGLPLAAVKEYASLRAAVKVEDPTRLVVQVFDTEGTCVQQTIGPSAEELEGSHKVGTCNGECLYCYTEACALFAGFTRR